jgi:hypothetical protein
MIYVDLLIIGFGLAGAIIMAVPIYSDWRADRRRRELLTFGVQAWRNGKRRRPKVDPRIQRKRHR